MPFSLPAAGQGGPTDGSLMNRPGGTQRSHLGKTKAMSLSPTDSGTADGGGVLTPGGGERPPASGPSGHTGSASAGTLGARSRPPTDPAGAGLLSRAVPSPAPRQPGIHKAKAQAHWLSVALVFACFKRWSHKQKVTTLTILSGHHGPPWCQVVQPSPPSVPGTLHLPEQELCPHETPTSQPRPSPGTRRPAFSMRLTAPPGPHVSGRVTGSVLPSLG